MLRACQIHVLDNNTFIVCVFSRICCSVRVSMLCHPLVDISMFLCMQHNAKYMIMDSVPTATKGRLVHRWTWRIYGVVWLVSHIPKNHDSVSDNN